MNDKKLDKYLKSIEPNLSKLLSTAKGLTKKLVDELKLFEKGESEFDEEDLRSRVFSDSLFICGVCGNPEITLVATDKIQSNQVIEGSFNSDFDSISILVSKNCNFGDFSENEFTGVVLHEITHRFLNKTFGVKSKFIEDDKVYLQSPEEILGHATQAAFYSKVSEKNCKKKSEEIQNLYIFLDLDDSSINDFFETFEIASSKF